jgi:Mg-chelatase subunit ChlD
MHSVLQNDKKIIEDGNIITEALNQGLNAFTPDLLMEQLVKNFSMAKNLHGPKLLRLLTGYSEDYLEKNIRIPEFQREIKTNIGEKISDLKDKGLLDESGALSEKGFELASLTLYIEELDTLTTKDLFGEKIAHEKSVYGEKDGIRNYSRGTKYRDISIRKSLKTAIRRNHRELSEKDLRVSERNSKGTISIIYGLDASGSMKGEKIELCKKAGVALAYKAIQDKNKVGIIVFGADIKKSIPPTNDFILLLKEITRIKASMETNMTKTIEKSIELFQKTKGTKHLILITDAMPTVGKEPEKESLHAASIARAHGITISLVGIDLNKKTEELAEQLVELGEGRFYTCRNIQNLDAIVLADYHEFLNI